MPAGNADGTTRRGLPIAGKAGRLVKSVAPHRTTGPRLTARDREVVTWICRHGVVVIDQIADKFFGRGPHEVGKWAAYKRMKALENLGLVVRDKPFHRAADVIRVTRAGARLADCGVGPAKLVLPTLSHDISVVDLTEDILHRYPDAHITTERELWAEDFRRRREGSPPRKGRMPDGAVTLPKGYTAALELDMQGKRSRDVERIMDAYLASEWKVVWWFVPSDTTLERYKSLVAQRRTEDVFKVLRWNP